MHRYLDAALNDHEADTALVASIQQAQESWEDYRQAHCDAMYTQWRDGTIRGVMSLSCKKQLTQARIHTLWESFLVTMEGEPLLPEPSIPRPPASARKAAASASPQPLVKPPSESPEEPAN